MVLPRKNCVGVDVFGATVEVLISLIATEDHGLTHFHVSEVNRRIPKGDEDVKDEDASECKQQIITFIDYSMIQELGAKLIAADSDQTK